MDAVLSVSVAVYSTGNFKKDFDNKFCIVIDGTSTEKEASSSIVVNTFDKMMGASQAEAVNKLPKRKKEAINKFTGDALEGVVNVCLQIDCNTHVEFPYYVSTLAQPDICAFCAAVGATKDQDAIKTHCIVLPVCRDCVLIGKLPPKRNPIKY